MKITINDRMCEGARYGSKGTIKNVIATCTACAMLFMLACCDEEGERSRHTGPELMIAFSPDVGKFFTHDFYLRNKSGIELSEVDFEFKILDEQGNQYPGERRWKSWENGEQKHIQIDISNTTPTPQKFKYRIHHIYEGKRCVSGWHSWGLN